MVRRVALSAIVVLVLAGSTPARAQAGDDWTTFPPTPPIDAAPAPAPAPGPAKPAAAPAPAAPADTVAPAPSVTSDAGTAAPGLQEWGATETPAPAPAPAPADRNPDARERVEARLRAAEAAAGDADAGVTLVSKAERFLPGTEPHSPATSQNRYNAKENLRVTAGAAGIGVLDVSSADLGPKGLLRFYANGEYLNQGNFPVRGATDVRTGGTFGVSFVPVENIEAYLSYAASANSSSRSSPTLIQSLGDITLGGKYARRLAAGFDGGVDLRLTSFSGVGNQSVSRFALGFAPKLVATYDLREAVPELPLRVHANLGFILDSTGGLVKTFTLNSAEEFALGVNRYNRFAFGAAVEAPLPAVTPFLEYNVAAPLGVAGDQLIGPDGVAVPAASAMAQTLALGLKVTAVKDLTLAAAMDFGLARYVGAGVPATPPFDFRFGASFNIDPFQRGETRFVETLQERKVETAKSEAPKTSKVSGTVVDAATHKPIPGVIVAMVGAGLPPVASDAETGHFLTHELPGGPVKLSASKDGYKAADTEVTVEPGKVTLIEVALEAAVKRAHFDVTVATKKKPVAATVVFKGPVEQRVVTAEGAAAPTPAEVPGGTYHVVVTAEGYLAQTREVQVAESGTMAVAFDLTPEPKKKLVILKENKIEVTQQVHFVTGKSTIMTDSYALLAQVVDVIVKNDLKKLRVEGHTDNKGGKAANQTLSEGRAKAVADYLVSQGIDTSRIESAGFGDSRPVAPNLTSRGRELNRRVEFVIVER